MLMNYIAKHSRDHASWFRMCITREVDRKGPSLLVTNKLTNIKTLGFVYQYIFLSYTMLCVHVFRGIQPSWINHTVQTMSTSSPS